MHSTFYSCSFMCSEDLTLLCITQSDRNARDRIWPGVGGHVTLPYVITPELGQLEASLFFKCLIACFFFWFRCSLTFCFCLAPKTREILSAMKMISDKCCVTFHEREDEDHYINFSAASG